MIHGLYMQQISTYIIKGKKHLNTREFHGIYDQSFKAWHETWEKTYKIDFHSNKDLASDEFTRQDEIIVLFYKGECAALCFFSDVNINDKSTRLDSYFQCWPENAMEALSAQGPNIIVCSQFTVCENFRKEGPIEMDNTPWKMILTGISVKYFMASGRDAMTGTMRVNKGMGKLTYYFGSVPIIENLEYTAGQEKTLVDLVVFFQDNVYESYYRHSFANYLDQLWEGRNARRLKIAA
ncbi:MAG: hypothetical protein ACXVLQ_03435 [Bacteriovorax sp.]